MSRPAYEIAEVFGRYGSGFQTAYARFIGPLQLLVLKALAACRTSQLGGHVLECTSCGHRKQVFHSCGKRHCPKCQAGERGKWFEDRAREIYNLLFRATAETLTEVAAGWKDHSPCADIGGSPLLVDSQPSAMMPCCDSEKQLIHCGLSWLLPFSNRDQPRRCY
jgi:hypothetical protein